MKQAVVLIHGIGEQKPMDTLRGFVDSVLDPPDPGEEAFWSKPDPLSDLFELRRLQSRGRSGSTHFYEYYWAYKVEGTSLQAVLAWLWSLIWRSTRGLPHSARALIWMARLSLGGLCALLATGVAAQWVSALQAMSPGDWRWLTAAGLWLVLQGALIHYLGDAARYLSPRPGNIRLRRAIRADGTRLLQALHERGEYERIIVVGHSLGSVIGYDILNAWWQRCHEELPGLTDETVRAFVRDALKGDGPQPVLRSELSVLGEALRPDSDAAALDAFREAQLAAQMELRKLGHPWRVTDFVTLGSPLTHGALLLARSSEEFAARKRQRELPTCPPQRDDKGYAYGVKPPVDIGAGKKFTPLLPHHAAAFAVTRWTNLYAPARWGLFGDIVGGPLAGVFGCGIRDIAVRVGGWRGWTVAAHTAYWRRTTPESGAAASAGSALKVLVDVLALRKLRQLVADRTGATPKPAEQTSDVDAKP